MCRAKMLAKPSHEEAIASAGPEFSQSAEEYNQAVAAMETGLMELTCCKSNPVLFYYRSLVSDCNNTQTI
jgi:hypothetical protein